MKHIQFILLGIYFLAMGLYANGQQGEVRMTASLAGASPTGNLKDIVDKTSLRGVDINILYGFTDKFSGGLNIGFQDFYEKFPRALYKMEDGSDISAVITNSVQTIPFLATGRFSIQPAGRVQPYASAGLGGAVVINRQFVGEYPNSDTKIRLAARPGLGVYIPFRKQGETGVNLGVNYTYIPYKLDNVSNVSFIGFTLGIGFPMRN